LESNTFFLIPDISGFTRFVSQTEVSHGQHIISELLEILIDANVLDLTVAEIEGDAVLFYKKGRIPETSDLLAQAQKMFVNFHQHLKKYQGQRICECGACRGAGSLSLKIIAHAGNSEFIKVKGHQKPYGSDVILVHRLLKNNIPSSEYLLLSDQLISQKPVKTKEEDYPWLNWVAGSSEYESLGLVSYHYSSLSDLHETIPEPEVKPSFTAARPIIVETFIERPRDEVFEIIIDFEQRMKWNQFANRIDYDPEQLNQVGAKHVCVFDSNTIEFESVKGNFGTDQLVYGEKLLDPPAFIKDITIYFIVGHQGEGASVQLQIHYLLKFWGKLMDPILRRKNFKVNTQLLQHLKEYCENK
jgi:hypothetical protein